VTLPASHLSQEDLLELSQQCLERVREAVLSVRNYALELPSVTQAAAAGAASAPAPSGLALALRAASGGDSAGGGGAQAPQDNDPAETQFRALLTELLAANVDLRAKAAGFSDHILDLNRQKLERFERMLAEKEKEETKKQAESAAAASKAKSGKS
jgi:hypothetical protein